MTGRTNTTSTATTEINAGGKACNPDNRLASEFEFYRCFTIATGHTLTSQTGSDWRGTRWLSLME